MNPPILSRTVVVVRVVEHATRIARKKIFDSSNDSIHQMQL